MDAMSSVDGMELAKYLGFLAAFVTAVLGVSWQWSGAYKSKSSGAIPEIVAQSMASNIEKDSGARRDLMEALGTVNLRLADNMTRVVEISQSNRQRTEDLHEKTRGHIDALKSEFKRDLGEIKDNQIMINETIKDGVGQIIAKVAA